MEPTREDLKKIVDDCVNSCCDSVKEMFLKIDDFWLSEADKNAIKVLLRSRVANRIWSIAHPHAMEIILENMKEIG